MARRYSVTVELPVAKHVKKGKKAARQRTFSLREDDDGWESINDAQNAVAALVLFEARSSSRLVFASHASCCLQRKECVVDAGILA